LKFLGEAWTGRACAGANEVELTKVPKSGGRRRKNGGGKRKKGGGKKNKMGPARGRRVTSGHSPPAGLFHCHVNIFKFFGVFFFFFFLTFVLGSFEELPGILEEWMHNIPIFSSFPLHLEVSNLPILIEFGDFTFFENLFFENLE
jgi:hypothetical protein